MSESLIFPKREELQRQIEEFNAQMSGNCILKECEFPIFPEINQKNEVLLSEKLNVVLTLYTLYPAHRRELRKLIFLYHAVGLNIVNGNYPNATACLKDLYGECSNVKKRLKEIHHPPVFVNLMTQALLAHELCHYKFRLNPELREAEISDVKKEIEEKGYPKAFSQRCMLKYAINRLKNDKQQLEEIACDRAAAIQLAKLLNSGVVEDKYVEIVIEQTIRLYTTFQLWRNLNELPLFSFKLSYQKHRWADHIFCLCRVWFLTFYIVGNLEQDCEFPLNVLKRENIDYNHVFGDMMRILRSNIKYGSAFSLPTASGDYDEGEVVFQEAIREDYKKLGKRIMDYLEYIIHSD